MSHLINTIESQRQDRQGNVNLSLESLGNFTSTTSKRIGFNGSGSLVQVDPPTSTHRWNKCYHYVGQQSGWGGGGYLTYGTNNKLHWRKNTTTDIDSSYAADLYDGSFNGTWANQVVLQAGSYLVNFSFNGRTFGGANDSAKLRLKNVTDNVFLGVTTHWGASQQSNTMFVYLTLSSQKTFEWYIPTSSITGTPTFPHNTDLVQTHLNVWRIT